MTLKATAAACLTVLLLAACSGGNEERDPAMIMVCNVEDQVCSSSSDCCSGLSCSKSGNFKTKVCRRN